MDKIVALCKRRGFIFGSSEIYGGIGGFWDYGPLGTELKRNVKDAWWLDMVRNHPPGPDGREYAMVGVDCSIIMNPKVWEASGHVGGFSDPMVDCTNCKRRFRADQLVIVELRSAVVSLCLSVEADEHDDDSARQFVESIWRPRSGAEKKRSRNVLDHLKGLIAPAAHAAAHVTGTRAGKIADAFENNVECALVGTIADDKEDRQVHCPDCLVDGVLTKPRQFNLMFKTFVGASEDSSSQAYLRPETAQGIFVNFKNVLDSTRVKLPLGIAQIGKAFRNEINPRNYTFRSREFEQYEIEFFCHPSEAAIWYEYWRDLRHQWYVDLGLTSEKLRLRDHQADELAHYAESCADVEYDFPFGISELEGIANRTDFDLKAHQEKSGKDLTYFDDQRKERYTPYVIEPSGGVDRSVLAFITEAYHYDESRASKEFMTFHPRLAPIKAAVFPLVAKDGMPEIAEPIYQDVRKHYPCQYDAKQSIGRRYARMDEAGTPFCFTIDGQTKEDGTVTVRNRDDASQIRINKSRCLEYLRDQLHI